MQRLAADQKSKRESKQTAGRKPNPNPNKIQAKANPFSRFLSAFSVDTKYPHHKRAYEDQEDDLKDEPPPKQQKMNDSDKDNGKSSSTSNTLAEFAELFMENLPFVAAAAVASLAMLLVFRKKQP
jgi:hypothetical protein